MSMTWKTKIRQRNHSIITGGYWIGTINWNMWCMTGQLIRPFQDLSIQLENTKYGLYIRQHFVNNVKCLKSDNVLWLCRKMNLSSSDKTCWGVQKQSTTMFKTYSQMVQQKAIWERETNVAKCWWLVSLQFIQLLCEF